MILTEIALPKIKKIKKSNKNKNWDPTDPAKGNPWKNKKKTNTRKKTTTKEQESNKKQNGVIMAKKYYAVKVGKTNGIFENWTEKVKIASFLE